VTPHIAVVIRPTTSAPRGIPAIDQPAHPQVHQESLGRTKPAALFRRPASRESSVRFFASRLSSENLRNAPPEFAVPAA
jgi:hypothetical protein